MSFLGAPAGADPKSYPDGVDPVTLTCLPSGRRVALLPGEDLLRALRRAGQPIGSSCDGDGICGKCGVRVLAGEPPPPGELELRCLERNRLQGLRLACQLVPTGDLVVTTAYW